MTKAIFILENLTREKIDMSINLGVNALFTGIQNLTHETVKYINKNNLKLFVDVGIFQAEDLWHKYPDSIPVDQKGNLLKKTNWYAGVCPNNPQVRKEKLTSIKRLIEAEKVDGVWLDFIRYPCHWEEVRSSNIAEYCFCSNCLNKYNKDVGGKPEGKKWANWKCKQIVDFVLDVKTLIRRSKKNITLGVFAVPWKEKEYEGAIKRITGQDFKLLAKHIDVFSPMVYQKFCDRSVSWIRDTVKYFAQLTNKPILPIIQTEDRTGKIYMNEFRAEIINAMMYPSKGVIIFFLEDLIKDKNKIKVMNEIF